MFSIATSLHKKDKATNIEFLLIILFCSMVGIEI